MPTDTEIPWYQLPPDDISLEDADAILSDPTARLSFPNQFNDLLVSINSRVQEFRSELEQTNRLAFFQPSYEQALKLNVWIWGIDYVVDFDANRIGKTAGGVVNMLLWALPNDPDWICFSPFTDHKDRTYRLLPRPPISAVRIIRAALAKTQQSFNPRLPFDDPENQEAFKFVQEFLRINSQKFPPNPPRRTFWYGGPTNDWLTKEVAMPEFKKWTPTTFIETFSEYEGKIVLQFTTEYKLLGTTKDRKRTHTMTILFKSYDSSDTVWSGSAVDGIMLSEGVPIDVFNEVRQRYKYPAFGSWDYTPYEARNTASKSAIAYKVFKDPTRLPLNPIIFSGYGIVDAPTYILDEDKRKDLIKNWENDPQGDARIRGLFYSSSPVVLKNYSPAIHALPISFVELKALYHPRPLILFRGIDPGWAHVTGCCWMALAPDNTRYIYRFYAESNRSIEERCTDIIRLSNNERIPHPKQKGRYFELASKPDSEKIHISFIDYHSFKTDENTKRPFANNYIEHGVIVRPSITFGPKERGTMFNNALQPQAHLPHPLTDKPPGAKVYFLINEPGVAKALQKMENLFWMTFEKGEKRGMTKDAIQDYDDDEMDAASYVVCQPLTYQSLTQPTNLATTKNNHDPRRTGSNAPATLSYNSLLAAQSGGVPAH